MAATSQSPLSSTAAIFAGGLAIGIGGAVALSRSAFFPASKPTRSTKDRARKGWSSIATPSQTRSTEKDIPASQKLDASDAKGVGPAAPREQDATGSLIANPVLDQPKGTSVTGKPLLAEPSALNRVSDLDTRMDLIRNDAAAVEQKAPVWLSGSEESNFLATSTGQIDKLAFQNSSAVFVYESAANAGFGAWPEKAAADAQVKGLAASYAKVISMQTRAGAGNAIAGYLAESESSVNPKSDGSAKIVTALTDAEGFVTMAPSLATIAASPHSGRLVLQVSAASQEREEISNDYSAVLAATSTLSSFAEDITVVLSAGRQEAINIAAATYAPDVQGDVAHIFDGAFAGIEAARSTASSVSKGTGKRTVAEAIAQSGYSSFEYVGAESPSRLLVVPNGSHFSNARAVYATLDEDIKEQLGVVSVRVVRPWSDAEFLKLIGKDVECVHVLDEVRIPGMTGALYEDVQATISGGLIKAANAPVVQPISLRAGEALSAGQWIALLKSAATTAHRWQLDIGFLKDVEATSKTPALVPRATAQLITCIDTDSSSTSLSGSLLARIFRERNSDVRRSRISSKYDNFESGGLVRSDVILSQPNSGEEADIPLSLAATESQTHVLVIGDVAALKGYNVFKWLAPGGTVIINAPGWDGIELAAKLRAEDKIILGNKSARILLLDAQKLVDKLHDSTAKARGGKHLVGKDVPKETAAPICAAAILIKALNFNDSYTKALLKKVLGAAPLGTDGVSGLVDAIPSGLQLVAFSNEQWKKSQPVNEAEASASERPSKFRFNSFVSAAESHKATAETSATRATWALPAWQSIFSEAYKSDSTSLRPDLPEENWVLTVTENRRLTPLDYERNVFHMELSTAGTSLKYEVGEALGIHGWNDEQEVRDFISWSGYNPDEIVSVASLGDPSRFETRTVFQVLQQRLDIFGKPAKNFYDVLSKLATDPDEAKWLRFVGSAEGTSTFKKLSEIETVTYADVLRMFPSARLPIDVLMTEVEQIKPRHYSIASAQSFVGDSVHLLIVTVDWRTPTGSPRFGQCTRYLANLKVGEQVTVSLKPSVMKLPPLTTQPIVMSGLGTGAAPFRAYIQARAVQKKQGLPVGPMIYVFGSRYKHAEYLYGEELEAYEKDGLVKVLTAFSRDQKEKIYIQHRIEQNADEILNLIGYDLKGLFTLCGPTDPLPDVQEALIKGYMDKYGKKHNDGEAWLEELKEDERAVYEVY